MLRDGFDGMVAPPFGFITGGTPAIPEYYWNVYSEEQRWKFLCVNLARLVDFVNQLAEGVTARDDAIEALQAEAATLKSDLVSMFADQINDWLDANMRQLLAQSLRFVMFGINADGRYVAYVPDNWSEIIFDFGAVYGRSDYNRIKLQFDAEGNAINNLYSYTLAQPHDVAQLIADLEVTTSRGDVAFDTLFKNLDEEVGQDANQ